MLASKSAQKAQGAERHRKMSAIWGIKKFLQNVQASAAQSRRDAVQVLAMLAASRGPQQRP